MVLSFEDWKKVELKVGLMESVEDIPGKDKLYKMTVDFASEKRTILAGLKPFYSKDQLRGKKAVFVFNLAPRAMAGMESNGMILAMRDSEGKYRVSFADDSVPQGTQLE
jgi:methionyl-tRNA synthetase